MTGSSLEFALLSGISLAALWGVLFFGVRKYCIDKFRQDLFALRDRLFDEARRGNVEFGSDAYRVLRRTMNGYIRFGHRLNLTSVVIFGLLLRQEDQAWLEEHGFNRQWASLIRDLPEDQQEVFEDYRRKMESLVVRQLVFGSPALVLSVVPVILFLLAVRLQVAIVKRLRAQVRRILSDQMDGAALAAGQ